MSGAAIAKYSADPIIASLREGERRVSDIEEATGYPVWAIYSHLHDLTDRGYVGKRCVEDDVDFDKSYDLYHLLREPERSGETIALGQMSGVVRSVILDYLRIRDCTPNDLVDSTGYAYSTIYNELSRMMDERMVTRFRVGKNYRYRLVSENPVKTEVPVEEDARDPSEDAPVEDVPVEEVPTEVPKADDADEMRVKVRQWAVTIMARQIKLAGDVESGAKKELMALMDIIGVTWEDAMKRAMRIHKAGILADMIREDPDFEDVVIEYGKVLEKQKVGA
jgi:DNA-binding transcriptional ArsR family regulator